MNLSCFRESETLFSGLVVQRSLAAEADAALVVDIDALHAHCIARFTDGINAINALISHLGNVHEAFFTRHTFNKGTEVHNGLHSSFVNFIQFRFCHQASYKGHGCSTTNLVGTGDEDHSFIVHLNGSASIFLDLLSF